MADIQCKMCGGELALPENAVSGICQYCDSRCGTAPAAAGNSNPLLKRAQLFLEQGDFESAKEYCENVLDGEPENCWAYFIRMMAELKATDEKQLVDIDFSGNKTFQLATRFADAELKSKMDGILKAKRKIEEEARKKALRSRKIFFSVTGVVLVVIIRISISSYRYSMQLKNGDICRIEDNVVTGVVYNRYKIKKAVIPPGVTTIGRYAFSDGENLRSVTIPDSVTTIGEQALSGCAGLTSVEIPDSVTTIGRGAFAWCSNLTSVEIPDCVTTIGKSAFSGCSNFDKRDYSRQCDCHRKLGV